MMSASASHDFATSFSSSEKGNGNGNGNGRSQLIASFKTLGSSGGARTGSAGGFGGSSNDTALHKQPKKRSAVLDKLMTSPFAGQLPALSATGPPGGGSGSAVLKPIMSMSTGKLPKRSEPGGLAMESDWSIKNHASDVLSNKPNSSVNKVYQRLLSDHNAGKARGSNEMQGPIDWSHNGLKGKYRDERSREGAWKAFLRADRTSTEAFQLEEVVLPVAKIERHPLYVAYETLVSDYNMQSRDRTRNRLLMKRFVIDVQEVWLTNLQHLQEHQPSRILDPDYSANASLGSGLHGRRDIKAIESMHHQIQSVIHRRALMRAFYTTRLPEPTVTLDYIPGGTPKLMPAKAISPVIEFLDVAIDFHRRCERTFKSFNHDFFLSYDIGRPTLLHVDRLLPSPDYNTLHQSVLWRLTLLDQRHSLFKRFVLHESTVMSTIDMLHANSAEKERCTGGDVSDGGLHALQFLVVPITTPHIEYEISTGSRSFMSEVRLQLREYALFTLLHVIVDIKQPLASMSLDLSLADAARFLGISQQDARKSKWWLLRAKDPSSWLPIVKLLQIEPHHGQEAELDADDSLRWRLKLTGTETYANRVPGAVDSIQARVYASMLLDAIAFDESAQEINIQGVDSHLVFSPPHSSANSKDPTFKQLTRLELDGDWESILNLESNMSMKVSGAEARVSLVPGASEIGRRGLWFKSRAEEEFSQACAIYFRDQRVSTSNTVLVNMVLAIDSPLVFPVVVAWEEFQLNPPKCQVDEVDSIVPTVATFPVSLYHTKLNSPLEDRLSFPAMIFSSIPTEGVDYQPLDLANKPKGAVRHWPFRNEYGFRRKVIVTLLGVDPVLPTMVFGITKNGAQPNVPAVNIRNIWHSTLAITEHINRPRAPKDYHYIIANSQTRGANDPAAFVINLHGHEFVGLTRSGANAYEEEYRAINERRNIFARQLALDAKIEQIEINMKTRDKMLKAKIQKELQMVLEKKLRKANKSEKGWRRRVYMSTLLEVQGNWERRRDDRVGTIFFRRIVDRTSSTSDNEKYLETCQWEVPTSWVGDPLHIPQVDAVMIGAGDNDGDSLHSLNTFDTAQFDNRRAGSDAFEQPADDWVPESIASTKTPGAQMRANMRAPKDINSTFADKSLAFSRGSTAATIDTANLEHIAEQLLSSDELMRALAKRLGLPASQIVAPEDMNSVFSVQDRRDPASVGDSEAATPLAPRDQWTNNNDEPAFDSDDDLWSDNEQEVGDHDENEAGDMPESREEAAKLTRQKYLNSRDEANSNGSTVKSAPKHMPYLNLKDRGLAAPSQSEVALDRWKRMPRADINKNFFEKCTHSRTLGPDISGANTLNNPIYLMPISPVDACVYDPIPFEANVGSMFVPNARVEMERALATLERQIRREEELARNIPTDDLLLFGEAKELTSADAFLAKQQKQDQSLYQDPREAAIASAIVAAKSSNIAQMEDALEEDIPVDSTDQFGNTLLILAAQQGSKRMCKFLLRRGAKINLQNLSGNTCMHYCIAYGHKELGPYLKAKGADDSILNVDGMTCYEGLNRSAIDEDDD